MNTHLTNISTTISSWSTKLFFAACLAIGYSATASATVIPIDLSGFYILGDSLSVSADGSSASFSEGFSLTQQLSDIPGYGDPNVVTATNGAYLQFDYNFNMPTSDGNVDSFHAGLLDGNTGNLLDSSYQTYIYSSGSGQIQYELSSLLGDTLGLEFELVSEFGDAGFTSTLTISNVQLVTKDVVATVPESGTGLLLLAGLLGMGLNQRRLRKNNREKA